MKKIKKTNSFEQDLKRLEEIADSLENNSADLDEVISLYEEGIKLSKSCMKKLNEAELRITELKNEIHKFSNDSEE
jgi:exodeoxyribonuclease VII small subunit